MPDASASTNSDLVQAYDQLLIFSAWLQESQRWCDRVRANRSEHWPPEFAEQVDQLCQALAMAAEHTRDALTTLQSSLS